MADFGIAANLLALLDDRMPAALDDIEEGRT
jgi:hypothetical protein